MNKLECNTEELSIHEIYGIIHQEFKKKILKNLHVAYHSTIFDKCIPEKHVLTILTM